jgi:hypothetical protein
VRGPLTYTTAPTLIRSRGGGNPVTGAARVVASVASDRNSGRKAPAPYAITAYRGMEVGNAQVVQLGPGVKQMCGTETGVDIC